MIQKHLPARSAQHWHEYDMTNILLTVPELTPSLTPLDSKNVLVLDKLQGNAQSSIEKWDLMRIPSTVDLLLNGTVVATQTVKIDPSTKIPYIDSFDIPTYNQDGSLNYKIGKNTIQYIVTLDDGTSNPNKSYSKELKFKVIYDEDSGNLKIDIAEGAAAYNDDYKHLMPANIAVIRGTPGTIWKAHGDGNTRFQEAGGADSVLFQLDDKGVCPIVLIKIDNINTGPRYDTKLALVKDGITITKENDKKPLLSSPVVFGNYIDVTGDASSQFKSYCINTKCIADGQTMSIVSIIMQDSNEDETLLVSVDENLDFLQKTLRTGFKFSMSNNKTINIINKTAEFAVTSQDPGQFNIFISSVFETDALLNIKANFLSLS